MQINNSFKKGLKDGIPICIGYFPVAFAFGIFAVENGLTVIQATLISLLNMTSAGQLAGVPIMAGGTLAELALSQLVINSRYSLMSVSISQKFTKSVGFFKKLIISFANTDEIFAIAHSNKGEVGEKYMWGLMILPIVGWTSGTFAGGIAGNILPTMVVSALGIAIYGMFVAIVVPVAKKENSTADGVALAIIFSCCFKYIPALSFIPSGFTIIICAVAASVIFAIISPIKVEESEVADNG